MIPTTEILGLVPDKIKKLKYSIESADIIKQDLVIKDLLSQINDIYKAITEISSKSVGLDRKKLIDLIFLNTKKVHGWSCEKISHLHLDNPDRVIIESLADAIIAAEKEIIVCKETERNI